MRRCLVSLKPPSELTPLTNSIITKLTHSVAIDKMRLFVKPEELLDGVESLTISPTTKKQERDVITKELLTAAFGTTLVCDRCGAKTDPNGSANIIPGRPVSKRLWQPRQTRCICGGLWATST